MRFLLFLAERNDREKAECWYQVFSECVHQDSKLQIILDYLFCGEGNLQEVQIAANGFQNPAIKKMLIDLNRPEIMQAEDNPTGQSGDGSLIDIEIK